MSPTLHRPSSTGGDTHHRFDFLHGIDLEREHVRHSPSRMPAIVAALVLLLAIAGALLFTGLSLTSDPVVEPAALTLHDSGIDLALREHDATPITTHDSGIDLLLRNP